MYLARADSSSMEMKIGEEGVFKAAQLIVPPNLEGL